MTDNFAFIAGAIAGLGLGMFVGVVLEREAHSKPCIKTVHYLEQKVTSHAK